MACLSLGKRKRNDLLAAIILSRDVRLVHPFQRPAIKMAKAFVADLDDCAASRYGLAHGLKPQGKALMPLVEMPPTTKGQSEVRKINAGYLGPFRVIVVEAT
jgi:hypothetical protein